MPIAWTLPALDNLDEIQDHIAQESPKAAYRLVNDLIDRAEALLSANRLIGRVGRVKGTREPVVAGTANIVVYRVAKQVEIVAVMHAARSWPDEFT